MTKNQDVLERISPDQVLKLNVDGAGNYRVQYDDQSWDLLLAALPKLNVADRVNLLGDEWALVQCNRTPLSRYLQLVDALPTVTELAERDQVISAFDFTNRLLIGRPERDKFQRYARSVLRPSFDALGWDPKPDEPVKAANLRASLITALGNLNDPGIIAGCRDRFHKFLDDPVAVSPDLRRPILLVVGRYADAATWEKIHDRGVITTNIAQKQNYYDALACATDPALIQKVLRRSLTNELPTSRAVFLVGRVGRSSDHPDIAWQFARDNMKALLAKVDSIGANSFAPRLFVFFSDLQRADELKAYAAGHLPESSAREVAKVIDEIEIRAALKDRLVRQLVAWTESRRKNQP
jgi:aminopeptidase N